MTRISKEASGLPFSIPENIYLDVKHIAKRITNEADEQDAVVIVTGPVGSGKSTWAMQMCAAMSKLAGTPFTIDQITFTVDQLGDAVFRSNLPRGSSIMYDEAVTGGIGRLAMTKEGKKFDSLLNTCRDRGYFLVLCIPRVADIHPKYFDDERIFGMFRTDKPEAVGGKRYVYGYDLESASDYHRLMRKGLRDAALGVPCMEGEVFVGWPHSKDGWVGVPFSKDEYKDKKHSSLAQLWYDGKKAASGGEFGEVDYLGMLVDEYKQQGKLSWSEMEVKLKKNERRLREHWGRYKAQLDKL